MKRIYFFFLLAIVGCNSVVPREEAAAFAKKQAAISWYNSVVDQALVFETDVGTLGIQLLPLAEKRLVNHVSALVEDDFYSGLKFHRALTEPVPFGLQVGEENTRDASYKYDANYAEEISSSTTEVPYLRGAVSLTGRNEGGPLGAHLFFHLGTNEFLDETYPVIGFIQIGTEVLDRIRVGTVIKRAYRQDWSEFPSDLTLGAVVLPHQYQKLMKREKP